MKLMITMSNNEIVNIYLNQPFKIIKEQNNILITEEITFDSWHWESNEITMHFMLLFLNSEWFSCSFA